MRFIFPQDNRIKPLEADTSASLLKDIAFSGLNRIITTNTNYNYTLKDVSLKYCIGQCQDIHQKYLFINKNSSTTTTTIHSLSANERIIRNWQQENRQLFQSKIDKQFFNIRQRKANWDHRNSKKPNLQSVNNAENTLRDILSIIIEAGRVWYTPFLTCDEDGFVNIEWHKGHHDLHLIVEELEIEYVKVWGVNIKNEMTLDTLDKVNILNLWDWLLNG